jgi:hypothetical protein
MFNSKKEVEGKRMKGIEWKRSDSGSEGFVTILVVMAVVVAALLPLLSLFPYPH